MSSSSVTQPPVQPSSQPTGPLPSPRLRNRRIVPVVLVLLALLDLRVDLQLLFDHPTFTALAEAIRNHPLACLVLLLSPSLWRRYRGG